MNEDQYVVRRRADGYVVWDSEARRVISTHPDEAAAQRAAITLSMAPPERTYGLTWYAEVEATSPEEAIIRSRKFIAPSYRDGWDPVEIQVWDADSQEFTSP